jgi:hypothetical protein
MGELFVVSRLEFIPIFAQIRLICAEPTINWLASNPIRFELIHLVSTFVDSRHCEIAPSATNPSADRRARRLAHGNAVGKHINIPERRRRDT